MPKSTYARNKTLDHRYGGPDYARPATLYIALFTAAPNAGGGGTEVAGGSYARAAVTNDNTNFPAAVNGQKSNAVAIPYAQATAAWGTVTHAAVFDGLSGGNMLDYNALDSPKTVAIGDTPSLPIGSVRLTES